MLIVAYGLMILWHTACRVGTYSIDDVVLPLPGGRVVYPQHETAQVYIDTAAGDGVSLEEAPHAVKEFQITFLVGFCLIVSQYQGITIAVT